MYLVVWTDNGYLFSLHVSYESLENEYALLPYIDAIRKMDVFERSLFGNRYLVFRFQ